VREGPEYQCKPASRSADQANNMTRKTTRWNPADSLETKEEIAAYLDAVLEDGDPDLLKAALGDIARAKGMTEIAEAAGLGRANLYKALSPDGNPEFATVARVLKPPSDRFFPQLRPHEGPFPRCRSMIKPLPGRSARPAGPPARRARARRRAPDRR